MFRPTLFFLLLFAALTSCAPADQPATASPAAPPSRTALPTATLALPTSTAIPAISASAEVTEVVNEVRARAAAAEDFRPVAADDILPLQGELQSGEESRARLDILPARTLVYIGPNTQIQLDELRPQDDSSLYTRLRLWAGNLWIVLNGGQMDVETSSGLASVRGSYMSLLYDRESGRLDITCLEGRCLVENEYGAIEMRDGQASTIPAPGLPPASPRPMTPNEYLDWLNQVPEATPYAPPADELLETSPLVYVEAYNGCLQGRPDDRGTGDWTLDFYNLATGETTAFTLKPEALRSILLPAGGYKATLRYPDGSQTLLALDERQMVFLDRCQETLPSYALEAPDETYVTIVNTCDEPWLWDFSGPVAFSISIAPGATYKETLPAGDYTAQRWWESKPEQVEQVSLPAGSDYYSASSCHLTPEEGSGNGGAAATPTAYWLNNPCAVTWFWKFTGPATIQISVPPNGSTGGMLQPIGTYTGASWYDVAAPIVTESGPYPPGSMINLTAGCDY